MNVTKQCEECKKDFRIVEDWIELIMDDGKILCNKCLTRKERDWINGELVYYPYFESEDLYDKWCYHKENKAVTNLVKIGMAFKTKELAIKCAKSMLNMQKDDI